MTVGQWILVGIGVVVVGGSAAFFGGLYSLSRSEPNRSAPQLGVYDASLSPCPDSPNCVSTQADPSDNTHFVEPIEFSGQPDEVAAKVSEWLRNRADAEIQQEAPDYIRAVFTSRVFKFRDDVEIYLQSQRASGGVIHFRSAARVGYGDMGANRARYQAFREEMAKTGIRDAVREEQ